MCWIWMHKTLFHLWELFFRTYFLCELHAVICKKFHYFLFLLQILLLIQLTFFSLSTSLTNNPKARRVKKFLWHASSTHKKKSSKNMQAWIYIIMAHLWIKWLQNAISIKFTLNCMFIVVLYCMKMNFFFKAMLSHVKEQAHAKFYVNLCYKANKLWRNYWVYDFDVFKIAILRLNPFSETNWCRIKSLELKGWWELGFDLNSV